jgi:hypothetical protein
VVLGVKRDGKIIMNVEKVAFFSEAVVVYFRLLHQYLSADRETKNIL